MKIVYHCLANKQNLNFLQISSYKKVFYLRLKIMKCCWHQKNLRTLSGFWFKIVYSLVLYTSWRPISNEHDFQWSSAAARIWPTSTQSLECRYTLLVTTAQWTDSFPTIQYLQKCNDLLMCHICHVCSIVETVPQRAFLAFPVFPGISALKTLTSWDAKGAWTG